MNMTNNSAQARPAYFGKHFMLMKDTFGVSLPTCTVGKCREQ